MKYRDVLKQLAKEVTDLGIETQCTVTKIDQTAYNHNPDNPSKRDDLIASAAQTELRRLYRRLTSIQARISEKIHKD
jgi:hypothetical protein